MLILKIWISKNLISYKMSIKIVVFGESEQAAKFLEKSKGVPN